MSTEFSPEGLQEAVRKLFELNNFRVEGPLGFHGSEVDLKAVSLTDPFADPIYIEVTTEYVDNAKLGKDLTKFILVREIDRRAKFLIVSSTGFTLPVKERATQARIECATYEDLFARFQQFGPYLDSVLSEDMHAEPSLAALNAVYEEPLFDDAIGQEPATAALTRWRDTGASHKWLIVVGEYGTGKTALTQVMLYRWIKAYKMNTALPMPLRLELRDFTRQFDARGLLHHFLDSNSLGHVSVDFLLSLIRAGRVVMLLDGYDEMAQYMHVRERRACLEALAQLSAEGAKGILTSRPNYFSEAEELQVLDALYRSLPARQALLDDEASVAESERAIDALLESHFIERHERKLRDLTREQTEALVSRKLRKDPVARDAVLAILKKVFRTSDEGAAVSLGGKPVIVTYLLQVADSLGTVEAPVAETISEWQVYDLIVRHLMVRDYRAAPEILPERRREFLRAASVRLSQKDHASLAEHDFLSLIRREFAPELRRLPADAREDHLQQLFADLRRSATLTRASDGDAGWRFSHNSLREFLLAEHLLESMRLGNPIREGVPITDAMRAFVASRPAAERRELVNALTQLWPNRSEDDSTGQLLSLLWDAAYELMRTEVEPKRAVLESIAGPRVSLDRIVLEQLDLGGADLHDVTFNGAILSEVVFDRAVCDGTNFGSTLLDEVSFARASLARCRFDSAILINVDFTGADVTGASFHDLDANLSIRIDREVLTGDDARGYLVFHGARMQPINPVRVLQHHKKFPIAEKVARKLLEQTNRQVRGLTQRGAARADPPFARAFLDELVSAGYVALSGDRQVAQLTDTGREALSDLVERRAVPPRLQPLFPPVRARDDGAEVPVIAERAVAPGE